jgi:tetratricopeptide (TPR) repeat protein
MQAQLRANRKTAALEEAEACVAAGKASKAHCKWMATAWRYYGMLLALNMRMPEALVAMSNAINLAKSKPTDDPLALARAYDAIGRTLLEIKKTTAGIASLEKALSEFSRHRPEGEREARETLLAINKAKAT